MHVGSTSTSVATIRSRDGLSGLEGLVVESAFTFVLRASDLTVLVANACVAFDVPRLTESEVLSIVDAFADLVLRDDFAVLAFVLLALVGGFPDGAGHSHAAQRSRHRRVAIRGRSGSSLALVIQVTLDLASNFADTVAAVVF